MMARNSTTSEAKADDGKAMTRAELLAFLHACDGADEGSVRVRISFGGGVKSIKAAETEAGAASSAEAQQ